MSGAEAGRQRRAMILESHAALHGSSSAALLSCGVPKRGSVQRSVWQASATRVHSDAVKLH